MRFNMQSVNGIRLFNNPCVTRGPIPGSPCTASGAVTDGRSHTADDADDNVPRCSCHSADLDAEFLAILHHNVKDSRRHALSGGCQFTVYDRHARGQPR
jgi:hypothetical protein